MSDAAEIELKFQAPAEARAGLLRAFSTPTARLLPLRAVYFDTADESLAAAGFALRLRREGRRWVQTLKGRGDGVLTRLEHEVALPARPAVPALDISRHAGTPAGTALAALLVDGAALQPRYATHIRRRLRVVRHGGARIEVAFDEGRIAAGEQHLDVHEVEFELLAGPPAALAELAALWVQRHGLWIDVRTKSERGHRLALGLAEVPATKAVPMALPAQATPGQAFAAALQAGLAQLLPNAAEITSGAGTPEHLHQVRVALRRLRTALRLLAGWAPDAAAAQALELALQEPFARLGAARDSDALAAAWLPALAAAGAPALELPHGAGPEDPAAVLRGTAFTLAVLRTLALALKPVAGPALPLAQAAHAVLAPLWRQARKDARAYAKAEPAQRHRTRRRLKRLRYATEFLLPALPRKRSAAKLAALTAALDALGAYNDAVVAEALFRQRAAEWPAAWFAVGWLVAQQPRLLRRAVRRLTALRR